MRRFMKRLYNVTYCKSVESALSTFVIETLHATSLLFTQTHGRASLHVTLYSLLFTQNKT